MGVEVGQVITIGIDNGLKGGLVALRDGALADWFDTPVIPAGTKGKDTYAVAEMAKIMVSLAAEARLTRQEIVVFIEHAQAMPKQGVASTFKTGLGFGLWQGICAGLELPFEVVHPRTWTKEMWRDLPAGDPKSKSMAKCQQLFPAIPLMKPRGRVLSMDGRADAALIAAYGLRRMRGDVA